MTTSTAAAVLRSATPADTGAISAIWHAGWRDGHLGHVPTALLRHRNPADFAALVQARIDATTVAITGSGVVGFVTAGDPIPVPVLRYEKQLAASAHTHDDHDDREGGRGPRR
jgi:hypothetical protein